MTRGLFYAPPLPAALVDRGGGNLLHRTLGRRADPCRRLTRNLAAALCLFVFSAQAASASLMAGRIVGVRGVDRERIVRIDWQYPWQLPPRFRNHCAYEVFTARPYCSNHCGSDYQFLYCSETRLAAVMSVAVIVTRAVCCVAIGRLRDIIEGQRRAEARLGLFRG